MKLEPLSGIDGIEVSLDMAIQSLETAKKLHAKKCCELRIDHRTVIMVTPENCNQEYAENYRDKMKQAYIRSRNETVDIPLTS